MGFFFNAAVTLISILIVAAFMLWFYLTQPLFGAVKHQVADITVDPDRLEHHVKTLSVDLHPREGRNLEHAADYIREQLGQFGPVTDMPFNVDGMIYRNVILKLGPAEGERVVVGAHYDSYGALPGADDNASAVAGLIELARALEDVPLRQPVELVAYTLEEPPYFKTEHMGSAVHAKRLHDAGASVALMISLEMIGYFSTEPDSQTYPFAPMRYFYPDRGNFIALVGNLSGVSAIRSSKALMRAAMELPVYSINAPTWVPGVDFSDHRNYWEYGYPAIMITDTAFYRNPHYHTAQDTWERLDYHKMAQVVAGSYAVVLGFAQ